MFLTPFLGFDYSGLAQFQLKSEVESTEYSSAFLFFGSIKNDTNDRKTRADTRHKMRVVCVLFTFENNTGRTDLRTEGQTDGRTDTTSYRDARAHLKTLSKLTRRINARSERQYSMGLNKGGTR